MSEATPPVVPADDAAVAPSAPVVETPVSDATPAVPADPAPASADPDSATPDEDAPAQPGRRNRAQERIEELAQTNKYLREHNEFLRDALARGLKPAEAPPAPAPAPVEPKPMPTLESCGYDVNEHAKQMAEWTRTEIDRGVKAGLAAEKTAVVAQANTQSIQEAANAFRKDHADFDVVLANPALQWTPTILSALETAGAESPALGYHLAHNPDKLAKIAKQTPDQQKLALGRILGELATAKPTASAPTPNPTPPNTPVVPPKTPQPAKTTNAPPPPTPVGGSAQPDIDPMKLSGTEWAKWRRQQLADKRAREAASRGASATRRNF